MSNILRRRSMGGEKKQYSIHDYMTISALEDGLTASLSTNACEYCIDGSMEWIELPANTSTLTINKGQTLSFRATELEPAISVGIGTFTISNKCNLLGNCMAMLYGDDAYKQTLLDKDYAFYKLFYNCDKIISVSEDFLPSNIDTNNARYCYAYLFCGCSSLTTAPKLMSTSVSYYGYYNMFRDCKSLLIAPELPARTLNSAAYEFMFYNCINLIQAPPSVCSTGNHSRWMFAQCSSLKTPPVIINTKNYVWYGYEGMFSGCTSLETAPELPWTDFRQNGAYRRMFAGCTSLKKPPKLPSTKLSPYCYYQMFEGCTALEESPELPATTLADHCYFGMFSGTNVLPNCSNIDFTSETVVTSGGLKGLFHGTKVTDGDLKTILPKNTDGKYCLPVTVLSEYCYDKMFSGCTSLTTAPELPATILATRCYQYMFGDCTNLTTAPELPATTLADGCYDSMFYGCSSLTTAPELPVTTLANKCYQYMFRYCTNLTIAPELPATTLVDNCYSYMFNGCTKLNYIKMLATDISATNCTSWWTNGVPSKGIFVKHPDMNSLPVGVDGIPLGWTVINNI